MQQCPNFNRVSIKDIAPEVTAESVSLMDDLHGDPTLIALL
ncbi:hypothetical protein [Candidatus Rickettsia kedanie]